jgi:hypothetical protein
MHSVSMAIRQLSHRSMIYNGSGFASGLNNMNNVANLGMRRGTGNGFGAGLGLNQGQGRNGLGLGAGQGQRMNQAQSDARMGQALRNLQGIRMQLASQGTSTAGHARAAGHVQVAIGHLNTALSIR